MGVRVAILMPSLRPDRWDAIEENLAATPEATLYPLGAEFESYAEAINSLPGDEPMIFTAADDLVFHDGWYRAALSKMRDGIEVVGTNDLHNPYVLGGLHSTHSLIRRSAIEERGMVIDAGPGSVLYPYTHQYTDSEMVETARCRGVFAPCLEAVVEHDHPDFGTRKPDAVDAHTRRNWAGDYDTFISRRHLWHFDGIEELDYRRP